MVWDEVDDADPMSVEKNGFCMENGTNFQNCTMIYLILPLITNTYLPIFFFFQACILALSLLLVVGFGSYYTGGPAEIFSRAQDNSRIELFK